MATVKRHEDICDQFLRDAEAELGIGDLLQASEKAWGAVAHYAKSVASERGWAHRTHRDVHVAARRLVELTDDPVRNAERLGLAHSLHQNFYEDVFEAGQVRDGLRSIAALVSALKVAKGRLPAL